jgi:hypothetical protein
MEEQRKAVVHRTTYLPSAGETGQIPGGDQVIHIHHHYAAPVIDTAPVNQNPGQNVLDRYVPYFFVLLGGLVITGGLAVIAVILAPVLIAVLGSVVALVIAAAAAVGAVAVLMIGSAAAIKSLRETLEEPKGKGKRRR